MIGTEHHRPPDYDEGRGHDGKFSLAKETEHQAIEFLQAFHPDRLWALTTFHPETRAHKTRTFDPATEIDKAREWITTANGAVNVYFHVNAPPEKVGKKTTKVDHDRAYYLHVDIDPRAGESLPDEQERIRALLVDDGRLAELRVPAPNVVVFTGGGYAAYWRLAEPYIPPSRDAEGWAEFERYNRGLALVLEGDAPTVNVDRVMRLAGTLNLPDEKKRAKGRVEALAELVHVDDGAYPLAAFDHLRPPSERSATPTRDITPANITQQQLDALPPRLAVLAVHGTDPEQPSKYPSRSEAVYDFLCNGARAGVPHDVLLGCILDKALAISAHVYAQKGDKTKYARQQLDNALDDVALDDDTFIVDKNGVPYANQRNIRVALKKLGAELRHDQFQDRLLINDRYLGDAEIERLWLEIEAQHGFRVGKDYFWVVVQDTARRRGFHPVRDYLAELRWDGTPRVEHWLARYCSADDSEYTRAVGKLFLVAAVRRVRQPGVKFDEMLVLESPQGGFKSSALQVLAVRDEWFTDDLPLNADTKRVIESLAGRWIVEAAELKGMRKGDVEHLKAFLSRRVDRARMAYGRMPVEAPRQCVIVGTTNSDRYLRDNTGNRRFWPVKVGYIDLVALKGDRDQLWAEAAHLESEGESVGLPAHLWESAAGEQEQRRVEDPFLHALAEALGDRAGKLLASDAWRIVGVLAGQRTQDHNARLGDAMRELGWTRTKLRFGGGAPDWCYAKGDASERAVQLGLVLEQDGSVEVVAVSDYRRTPDDGGGAF